MERKGPCNDNHQTHLNSEKLGYHRACLIVSVLYSNNLKRQIWPESFPLRSMTEFL
ncbi:Hypothetical predicted protein [Podarcis lilfordi]|uniref:Uncharacterized protein n=1 Tax=Podarcis lilfordi TaxID=74358 RepID=A0AA35JQP1_9SAUR|nr:Hypothetical predicted protein [Podarcis lilfordi]